MIQYPCYVLKFVQMHMNGPEMIKSVSLKELRQLGLVDLLMLIKSFLIADMRLQERVAMWVFHPLIYPMDVNQST